MPLLGAHMSVAGGLFRAFERIARVGGEALQIFTRNQRQWRVPEVSAEEAALFRDHWEKWGQGPVAVHDSYLINLASPDPEIEAKSIAAFAGEIRRADLLGIPFLITHPGSHMGTGLAAGVARFTANLDRAIDLAEAAARVTVLLETTAGQGTNLGSGFEELRDMLEGSRHGAALGVCFDTCHAFAAGYDLRTPESYARTMAEFARLIGLKRLRFFHLNDAMKGLGSRVDRHTHIGQGEIGDPGFALLLNDPRFRHHPMVLETPKGEELAEDVINLQRLRSLLR